MEGNRWLDGRTDNGTVGLASITAYPFTGTRWRAHKLRDGAWAFRCLAEVPGNRWLDGRTATRTVGLAKYPDHQASGARWQLIPLRENVYAIKCLGEVDGNRYLDGVTIDATTSLAPSPGGSFTGTHWELRRERWWVGCNFIPSTAVNQLEMWQQDTFDSATITKELGWARELGFNAVRVFLHNLLWSDDEQGFKGRLHKYLDSAALHGIGTLFVFFDDCWNTSPKSGPQDPPIPDTHNSRWVQSPGDAVVEAGPLNWVSLETYVKGVIAEFAEDSRVIGWDLYNEPGGGLGHEVTPCKRARATLPLLKEVFTWARAIDPTQPLTAGLFSYADNCGQLNAFQLEASDVISFHRYAGPNDPESVPTDINKLKTTRRPLLCTEYMARHVNSRFENHLTIFNEMGVGCFNWGLVAGKTQTYVPWGGLPRTEEWFHDVVQASGAPYGEAEAAIVKCLSGKEASGAGILHNAIYQFKCLGLIEGRRWLDGRTTERTVGLAPETGGSFSGTRWRALEEMEGVFTFRCLGDIEGNRWLDGRTSDGSVGLAPDAGPQYSGTLWQLCRVRDGVYVFRCLGDVDGPRLLDGRTTDATVGLMWHSAPSITGILWQAFKLSDG
jgi:hypothetical protein